MKEVRQYLKEKLKNKDKIVVGVSGGPDSMCLLSLLLSLKEALNLEIIVAHVNHNIRKESKEEAEFVKKIAKENNFFYEYYKIDSYEQENFESNARVKRYKFFNELIKKYQANYLMTAHHGDDLIETILMRMVRGSNLNGYAGFKKETKYKTYALLRPLINTTKEEIEQYNKINNIEYRIDQTNYDENYTRNRYRKNILPLLKKENKNVHKKFLKFSEELSKIENFLEKETENVLTKVMKFDKVNLPTFNELDEVLKKRVIEYILNKEYQSNINCISNKHIKKILEICISKKANISIDLPKGRKIIKSYNTIQITKKKLENKKDILLESSIILNDKQQFLKLTTCDIEKSNFVIRLNSKEIELPLHIRYRKVGDNIEIKNLNGRKKIKDIFINEKIPLNERESWPIVVDNNDTILWIPGVKKSKFDKNIDEFYDIIYKYVISEEK